MFFWSCVMVAIFVGFGVLGWVIVVVLMVNEVLVLKGERIFGF